MSLRQAELDEPASDRLASDEPASDRLASDELVSDTSWLGTFHWKMSVWHESAGEATPRVICLLVLLNDFKVINFVK